MPLATLTSKGQTTIPKEVRDRLKLQPGAPKGGSLRDRIDFVIEGDRVYLKPVNLNVRRLSGMLHKKRIPRLTIENRVAVQRGIRQIQKGKAGFADYLIGILNQPARGLFQNVYFRAKVNRGGKLGDSLVKFIPNQTKNSKSFWKSSLE